MVFSAFFSLFLLDFSYIQNDFYLRVSLFRTEKSSAFSASVSHVVIVVAIFQDGEEIIKDFLSQVAKLPVEDMTEEQTAHKVSKLKEMVLAKNNPYIQELLAK